MASQDALINAEAIIKAACLRAAADLIAAGKIDLPQDKGKMELEQLVGFVGMTIWRVLEKPSAWTGE